MDAITTCPSNHAHEENPPPIAHRSNHTHGSQVREQFLKNESFNSRAETYTAIRKLLATLDDPFTRLLEPARLDALRRGTKGGL